jgi:glycosyltransferase involved in cell wall biosynthesis
LNAPFTIVLPVHNAERSLRTTIVGMLDLAEVLARRLQIAIVDDGSTDGTFEAASELAREFPQIRVMHQPAQRGLAEALEQVRLRLGVEHVIAHDGVARISLDELATLLLATDSEAGPQAACEAGDRGTRRLVNLSASSGSRRGRVDAAFRWLRIDQPRHPRRFSGRAMAPAFHQNVADVAKERALKSVVRDGV